MDKILVPTDFSDNAFNALSYAVSLANHFGSQITLLHAHSVSGTSGMFPSAASFVKKEAAERAAAAIEKVEPQLTTGGQIDTKIVQGSTTHLITELADTEEYDLILMGTQGASGLAEVFLGSTANAVIKEARVPVLVIPEGFAYRPIKQILFAIDDEGIAHAGVVKPLLQLAKKMQAPVRVFHQALGFGQDGIDPSIGLYLEEVEHSFHYELDREAVNASINSFVKDSGADLLCMLRRPRGFLEEVFHVSATTKAVFDSPVPLLVLKDDIL
jgi:nucleotide-binding universal stress UspA family protein